MTVEPATLDDAAAALGALGALDVARPIVATRFLITAGPQLRLPLDELAAISAEGITRRADRWELRDRHGHILTLAFGDGLEDPGAHLARLVDGEPPGALLLRHRPAQLAASLDAAARRCGLAGTWDTDPWPGHTLTAEQRAWMALWADPVTITRLRTITYLLVGLATGDRHDELKRYRIDRATVDAAGYEITVGASKADRDGANPTRRVDHGTLPGESATAGCSDLCPACALTRWLQILHHLLDHDSGLMFPAIQGWNATGELAEGAASRALRDLLDHVGRLDGRLIATRATRIGAATNAHRSGVSLDEIKEKLLRHETFPVTLRYIRHIDPWGQTPQLALPSDG